MLSDKSQDAYQANNQIQNPNFNLEITSEEDLDPDVMNSMTSLGCFKDKEMLIEQLLRFVPITFLISGPVTPGSNLRASIFF